MYSEDEWYCRIINIDLKKYSIHQNHQLSFPCANTLLGWFIHGDYERYLWIINGPYPFSHMGSAPFQLLIFVSLFIAGILFILISFFFRKKSSAQ